MSIDILSTSSASSADKKEHIMNEIVQQVFQGIVDGNHGQVAEKIEAALQAGVPARTILDEGMLAAMAEVGRLFEEGECYVPEMLISARAMKAGLAKLQPSLKQTEVQAAGTIALGTVKGDLHDLGKNLVGIMLEGAGFSVKDLGVDVSPEAFVAAADEVDRPVDHHHGTHEGCTQCPGGRRQAREGEGDRRWRAGHRRVRPPDWRGRLRPGCQPGGGTRKIIHFPIGLKQAQ
jgi:hypothetical protein